VRELYLLALYATRARGESDAETAGDGEHEVALRVALAVASDEAEARIRARERLFELCPSEAGWVNHHVAASELSREELRSVLAALSDEADAEGGPGAGPELIM
jgi:hypothetical protein